MRVKFGITLHSGYLIYYVIPLCLLVFISYHFKLYPIHARTKTLHFLKRFQQTTTNYIVSNMILGLTLTFNL